MDDTIQLTRMQFEIKHHTVLSTDSDWVSRYENKKTSADNLLYKKSKRMARVYSRFLDLEF